MKARKFIGATLVVALAATVPAFATYDSIQHNLINGVEDTFYDPGNHSLTVHATDALTITLNDPPSDFTGSTIVSSDITMTTTFSHVVSTDTAAFTGGSIALLFDFDPDGAGPLPVASYELSGPINYMEFSINVVSPTFSTIDGAGLFTATTKNLPGSGVWDDGGGYSSIDSLTLSFGADLSNWFWDSDPAGRQETSYSIFPDDRAVPEPATLVLLAFGGVALLRRR